MSHSYSLSEIAASLGLPVHGNGALLIHSVAEPADAGETDLALAMKPDYAADLPKGRARAAMLWAGADWQEMGLEGAILSDRPRYSLSALSAMVDPGQGYPQGVHPTAIVSDGAELGEGCSVGPWTYIGRDARIGAGSVIAGQVHIGDGVEIGPKALIHPGVRLMTKTRIGARAILHPNAVIGSDGFAFVTAEASTVEEVRSDLGGETTSETHPWARIASLGGVTIGDDVEIGVGCSIDRGTIRYTQIGDGTKLDNLVHLGHNVIVGRDCLLCGQVGIAGSTEVGDGVVMAGKVGVSDNLKVGDRVVLGGASVVMTNVPTGRVMLGYPATKMDTAIDASKNIRRLPRLFRDVADLKKAVSNLGKSD